MGGTELGAEARLVMNSQIAIAGFPEARIFEYQIELMVSSESRSGK